MRIGPVIADPVLYYKLDLGEPGIATPARAHESTLRVASHELENLMRFRNEALREGGYVIYSNIHLDREFKGSFLATVSGKTEVMIVKPREEGRPTTDNSANAILPFDTSANDNGTNVKSIVDKVEDKANDVEREAERKLNRIERELERKENLPDAMGEKEKLRASKAKLRRIMSLVRLKKMQIRQKKLLQNIQKNLSLAYKMAFIPSDIKGGSNTNRASSHRISLNIPSSESAILTQLQGILNSIASIDSYA